MRRLPTLLVVSCLGVASLATAGPAWGRAAVGVTTLTFTKTSVTTGAERVLSTVVWYPAVPRTGVAEALGRRDAKVKRGRFPLVVYSHGTCGRPTEATYLTTALARQGFIVAALPHPGNTGDEFPDCIGAPALLDSVQNRVPDVRFVLDGMLAETASTSSRFHRRIRTDAIAMAGLSFGGFTALVAVQQEPRFTVALALVPGGTTGVAPGAITIPTMVIGAERDAVVGFAASVTAYERLAGPRFLVELLGANHLSAVDSCFNDQLDVSLCVPEDITQEAAHELVLHYALPFMRRYLRNDRKAGRVLGRQVTGVTVQTEP